MVMNDMILASQCNLIALTSGVFDLEQEIFFILNYSYLLENI